MQLRGAADVLAYTGMIRELQMGTYSRVVQVTLVYSQNIGKYYSDLYVCTKWRWGILKLEIIF